MHLRCFVEQCRKLCTFSVESWTNIMSEGGHLPCPGVGIGQAGAAYKRRSKRPVARAGASAYENNLATITQEEDRQRPRQVLIPISWF